MPDPDLDLDRRLARFAGALDDAAPPVDVDQVIARAESRRRRRVAPSTPPRLLVGTCAVAVTGMAVVAVAVLFDGGGRPSDVVAGPPSTTASGTIIGVGPAETSLPITLDPDRTLPAIGILSSGPENGVAPLVLLDFDGEQVGQGSPGPWHAPEPDRGVEVVRTDEGTVVLRQADALRDPVPGCASVHGAGGLRVAAGCGDLEIRLVDEDGESSVLTGAAGPDGYWEFAIPSPDGAWVLAQWRAGCDEPVAYLVDAGTGDRRAVVSDVSYSESLGWAPDGRAVVSSPTEGPCAATAWEGGTFLVDPATGARTRISANTSTSLFTNRLGYAPNRIERMVEQASVELGLERAGCGEDNHGGETVFTCVRFEGHDIEISARPVADVTGEPGVGRVRAVCGGVSYTFGELDVSRPPAGLVERAADTLLPRLYCTRPD